MNHLLARGLNGSELPLGNTCGDDDAFLVIVGPLDAAVDDSVGKVGQALVVVQCVVVGDFCIALLELPFVGIKVAPSVAGHGHTLDLGDLFYGLAHESGDRRTPFDVIVGEEVGLQPVDALVVLDAVIVGPLEDDLCQQQVAHHIGCREPKQVQGSRQFEASCRQGNMAERIGHSLKVAIILFSRRGSRPAY